MTLLTERKKEYNTYTPSDNKMQNILLKATEINDAQTITQTPEKHGIPEYKLTIYKNLNQAT